MYSFGTTGDVMGHGSDGCATGQYDVPKRIEALAGVNIVSLGAGLYCSAFLDGEHTPIPMELSNIFIKTKGLHTPVAAHAESQSHWRCSPNRSSLWREA